MRIDIEASGRSVEAALFVRASSSADCHGRAMATWAMAFKDCKQCSVRTPSCKDELPARYAKLFDDVPISSTYLSANAGRAGERDGRIVIFGLTDEEGMAACEAMRQVVEKSYQGETYCVEAAGG